MRRTVGQKKLGPPEADPVSRFRAWFWYWHLRQVTGRRDAELEVIAQGGKLDEPRSTIARSRIFQTLRKTGSDPGQTTAWRPSSLIDLMVLRAPESKRCLPTYHSMMWSCLSHQPPSLEVIHEWVQRMLQLRGHLRPSAEQVEVLRVVFPEEKSFRWIGANELDWHLHTWGETFADLELAVGLLAEAKLAGAGDVVEWWKGSFENQLRRVARIPWLRDTEAAKRVEDFIGFATHRLVDSSWPVRMEALHRRIAEDIRHVIFLNNDRVTWFLRQESKLTALVRAWESFDDKALLELDALRGDRRTLRIVARRQPGRRRPIVME